MRPGAQGRPEGRTRDDDACPGALQVHQAADGGLARIRLAGGMITAAQLESLAHAAAEFGSPAMELTSRGNIQVRAIHDADGLAAAVTAAGLLPSATHERVRNIVASPLSGRSGGLGDIRDVVQSLDHGLQNRPDLAELPGRFWFGVDDGRGDISGLAPDVSAHLVSATVATVLIAGRDTGAQIPAAQAADTLLNLAHAFLTVRGNHWRTSELDDPDVLLTEAGLQPTEPSGATWPHVDTAPVGWITQDDGRIALGAAVPLGVLQARTAEFVAAITAPIVVTPWRSLLICDLEEGVADTSLRVLAPLGLIFDEHSPWLSVSACTGSPGCAKSLADVRSDAAAAAESGEPAGRRHFVGCERACGSPPIGEVLVATNSGYQPRHP
ncbi:precorrin-3B synthase [Mycobacterium sp. CBMA293]|nr:precorrin-3B synthase [Mycolicibacterium sp. CBMA 360]MUL56831.1 precorrin-3B synthase [Mycolicibacterium sp. CBMA 335]MUL69870.1 precorrin-3B synthase [Mycolicibacterium sp. CBMA 311]MUL91918.1 precorrin-3B synthase [Mycolicibacterium sp. CBMA 230]MUM05657.1 precorrin-3B synthase [Mycolicibacterium sp. CBMA 213]MUM10774.1 precorrin-3B synthase [Mycolicibacterium sp. CBMA 293]